MPWLYLLGAIISEVVGTSFLKASDGFSNLWPSVVSLLAYGTALFLLSQAVKEIELGMAYAIWAGLGTAAIVIVGWLAFGQKLDWAAVAGVAMIVGGVVVINAFSSIDA